MMRKFLEDKYDLGLDAEDTVEVISEKQSDAEIKAVESSA